MPRLVKGGKWVYGWVVVGPAGELALPPEARREYGFQPGEEMLFLPGSRRSGGFGIATPRLLSSSALLSGVDRRLLGKGRVGQEGEIAVPPSARGRVGVQAGDRLLAVRGSGCALGFVVRGPIYEQALRHPDLACFAWDRGEEH